MINMVIICKYFVPDECFRWWQEVDARISDSDVSMDHSAVKAIHSRPQSELQFSFRNSLTNSSVLNNILFAWVHDRLAQKLTEIDTFPTTSSAAAHFWQSLFYMEEYVTHVKSVERQCFSDQCSQPNAHSRGRKRTTHLSKATCPWRILQPRQARICHRLKNSIIYDSL